MGLLSVHLLFCEEVEDYWDGVIKGSGNKQFYGRGNHACMVQLLKMQKVVLHGNRLYIRALWGKQVMAENCLDAGPIPEETVAQMLMVSKPIDLWLTYFLSLTAAILWDRLLDAREYSTSQALNERKWDFHLHWTTLNGCGPLCEPQRD
jgi:hypothetical protein